jgi:hypothetical protein
MTVGTHDETQIRNFFDKVPTCLTDGRNDATVAYFAVKKKSELVVVRARMTLGTTNESLNVPPRFETENTRAGHFLLSQVDLKPKEFVSETLRTGAFVTPYETLSFPGNESGVHNSYPQTFEQVALKESRRLGVLKLNGGPIFSYYDSPTDIDWELKAAQLPFNGLADLATEYRLGSFEGSTISFDIEVPNALAIDPMSQVKDKIARVRIAPQFSLDKSEISLNVVVRSRGKVSLRESIDGRRLTWAAPDPHGPVLGSFDLDVPSGAAVDCIAVYSAIAQHQSMLVDKSGENQLRLTLDSVDSGISSIRQALHNEGKFKGNPDALESAMASVVSMLGFQVLHLGLGKKTRDAVDVVARCNTGGLLLIECTTAILGQDKVSKLVARAARLRRLLHDKDFLGIEVIPVIATTMTAAELYTSIDKVETDGVLVLCQEQFDEWLDLSLAAPDGDRLFALMSERLSTAQNRPDGTFNLASIPQGWALTPARHDGLSSF